MKKTLHKLTVRLSEEDILNIEKYAGENISEKVRSLLRVHSLLIDDVEGKELPEKYEVLLQDYLTKFAPMIEKEIEERRRELKKYVDVITQINDLQQETNKLHHEIKELSKQSANYIEKLISDCVVVRKNIRAYDSVTYRCNAYCEYIWL